MAYGTCNPLSAFQKLPLTSDGQCGKEANAKCEEGQCCSDNNYCGTTKDYCDAGCQSGYGVCNPLSRPQGLTVSPHGKCGRGTDHKCGKMDSVAHSITTVDKGEEYCGFGCQPFLVHVIPPRLLNSALLSPDLVNASMVAPVNPDLKNADLVNPAIVKSKKIDADLISTSG
ncbi:hypothetical protein BASA62_007964 [Batrachochytrium salamandrivorans]|nr:hypothetical protein BASA62_007964 [Batrachochytrium salamandrivorans]